ncbi:membrane protein YrrI [Desulfocucumis palustris]|uniref:Membrane protein YrrI n=1 Tax=Desulfocucumis palustris TaxID=1898651 RepID=A0A2L2XK07_9FIRM|nr:AI-2E family transporter [Desulfocucumis palustris]GBF34251.1 membrane protein YrrI [Desulfocucumis palustris]
MAWWSERLYHRRLFYGLLIVLFLLFLYVIRSVLPAFILAGVLVYLLSPIVNAVEKRGTGRVTAILLVYLAMIILGASVGLYGMPRLVGQLNTLASTVPVYTRQVQEISEDIQARYTRAGLPREMKDIIDGQIKKAEEEILSLAEDAAAGMIGLAGHVVSIFLAPVLAFYILKDLGHFKSEFTRIIPVRWRMDVLELLSDVNRVLKSYIQSYLLVCLVIGVLVGLTLAALGLEFALTLGIFAGLTELIPYFGPVIGAVPAVALALLSSNWLAVKVAFAFFIIQQLEGSVISPKLLGDRMGLHPLAVIVILFAGGRLYGLTGMLLAVPTAAVLKIFLTFAWRKLAGA